jgi:hypothetical protein
MTGVHRARGVSRTWVSGVTLFLLGPAACGDEPLTPTIDGVPQTVSLWRDHGQFTLQGDSVHFVSEFLQNVQFAGAANAGRLEIEQDLPGEGRLARYAFARQ